MRGFESAFDGEVSSNPTDLPAVHRTRILRDLRGLPPLLARSGPLDLRLATTGKEIRKAQKLRFRTFYVEGAAMPSRQDALTRRDDCPFDRICDHLLVIDNAAVSRRGLLKPRVVGTYRLLRSDVAAAQGGFYSATEFALDPLLARHPGKRLLELGRSCVHADYRSKRVIELLWRGIALYAQHHRTDALIGCASLPGTDLDALAVPLSFLSHHAAADPAWQVQPRSGRAAEVTPIAAALIDPRRTMAGLPPLVKAYVRAGGRFASGAVVDHQFGTTDLFAVLDFSSADARYMAHFGGLDLIAGAAAPGH